MSEPVAGARIAWAWVLAATLIGAVLRLYGLGSDLWLDEIVTVFDTRDKSVGDMLSSYTASNTHLLNSLMVKATVASFGTREWVVRLPAVLFGIATVPALYLLARSALRRRESVYAAFLIAVSYHHIFFSQSARGYSSYLFWSVLGTWAFLRALAADSRRSWLLWVVCMFLATASLLTAVFVPAGHALGLGLVLMQRSRRREPLRPLLTSAVAAYAALVAAVLLLYSGVVRQALVYVREVYSNAAVGAPLMSLETLSVALDGLGTGFGGWPGAILALVLMAGGCLWCLRSKPLYATVLIGPLLALGGYAVLSGVLVSPRMFLWALPVAILFVCQIAAGLSGPGSERRHRLRGRTALAVVIALGLASALSLPSLYSVPKQPTRAALEWLLARKSSEDVLGAVYLSEWGLRYYGSERGLEEGRSFLVVRSLETLRGIEASHPGTPVWLMTTFPRALRLELPELSRYIETEYTRERTFAAGIGDGDITVWKRP